MKLNSQAISLQSVMNAALIPPEQQTVIMLEYQEFKKRFINDVGGHCNNVLISHSESYLFQVHECSMACGVTSRQQAQCKDYMKILPPRKLVTAKFCISLPSLKIYSWHWELSAPFPKVLLENSCRSCS